MFDKVLAFSFSESELKEFFFGLCFVSKHSTSLFTSSCRSKVYLFSIKYVGEFKFQFFSSCLALCMGFVGTFFFFVAALFCSVFLNLMLGFIYLAIIKVDV